MQDRALQKRRCVDNVIGRFRTASDGECEVNGNMWSIAVRVVDKQLLAQCSAGSLASQIHPGVSAAQGTAHANIALWNSFVLIEARELYGSDLQEFTLYNRVGRGREEIA